MWRYGSLIPIYPSGSTQKEFRWKIRRKLQNRQKKKNSEFILHNVQEIDFDLKDSWKTYYFRILFDNLPKLSRDSTVVMNAY